MRINFDENKDVAFYVLFVPLTHFNADMISYISFSLHFFSYEILKNMKHNLKELLWYA